MLRFAITTHLHGFEPRSFLTVLIILIRVRQSFCLSRIFCLLVPNQASKIDGCKAEPKLQNFVWEDAFAALTNFTKSLVEMMYFRRRN